MAQSPNTNNYTKAVDSTGGFKVNGTEVINSSGQLIGDITAPAGSIGTAEIADDAVTYAKLQNVSATDRLLGRDTAAAGNAEELTVGGGIEFTGSGGIQTSAFTGDVTKSAGGTATTIATDAVTTAKILNANVTLAKLASGITPSHVVKYAGTTSAYGGGGTSNAWTVTGALATDVATAVIRASTNAVSITKAVLTNDTLTVHFSADPGAATTVDYSVLRAAA